MFDKPDETPAQRAAVMIEDYLKDGIDATIYGAPWPELIPLIAASELDPRRGTIRQYQPQHDAG